MKQEFINEVIDDGKDINDEVFQNYFKQQNSSFLAKKINSAN